MCRNLSVPTQASFFVCVLGGTRTHSRGLVPAPGTRSRHCAWRATSRPRSTHPTTDTLGRPGGPPSSATSGTRPGGFLAQPQRSAKRRLFLEGPRLCGQRAAVAQGGHPKQQPHTVPALQGRSCTPRRGCPQPPAPRAALCCGVRWLAPLGEQSSRPLLPGALGMGQGLLLPGDPQNPALHRHQRAHHCTRGRSRQVVELWKCSFIPIAAIIIAAHGDVTSPPLLHQQSQQHSSRAWRVGEHTEAPHWCPLGTKTVWRGQPGA